VSDRPGWHTARYIYPLGYLSTREFSSTVSKEDTTTYTSSIREGVEGGGPIFVVSAADVPGEEYSDTTPSGAWNKVFKKVGKGGALGGGRETTRWT
jgi:hypothetical protein